MANPSSPASTHPAGVTVAVPPPVKTAPPTALVPLVGDGTWPFLHAFIDGADIVVHGIKATRWGGKDDGEDSGVTACGFDTHLHSDYLGVSLPMSHAGISSMNGCPIPKLPWYTPVKVYSEKTGQVAYGHLIDIGPSKATGHSLDLTNALVRALGLSLADGVYDVTYRVINGAVFVKG